MQTYERLWKVGRPTARHVPGGVPGVFSSFTLKFSQQAVRVCGCDTEQRAAELRAEFLLVSEQTFSKTFNPFLFLTCHLRQRGKASFVSVIPGACLDYKFFEEEKAPGTVRPLSQIGAIVTAAIGSVLHCQAAIPSLGASGRWPLSGLTANSYAGKFFYLAGVSERLKFAPLILVCLFSGCINSLRFQLKKYCNFKKGNVHFYWSITFQQPSHFIFFSLLEIRQAGGWSKDDLSTQTVSSIFFQRKISITGKSSQALCGCCKESFVGRDLS